MTEANRKRIMYAVFVVAVIWGLYNQPWKRRPRPSGPPDSSPMAAVVTASTASPADRGNNTVNPATTTAVPGMSTWPVDPFRPVTAEILEMKYVEKAPAVFRTPILNGTMTVKGMESCVLDGQVYRVGEHAGDWRVVGITDGQVVLLDPNQQRITVSMAEPPPEKNESEL